MTYFNIFQCLGTRLSTVYTYRDQVPAINTNVQLNLLSGHVFWKFTLVQDGYHCGSNRMPYQILKNVINVLKLLKNDIPIFSIWNWIKLSSMLGIEPQFPTENINMTFFNFSIYIETCINRVRMSLYTVFAP